MRWRRSEIVLVVVPFTDGRGFKFRPAVVVGAPHWSRDEILVPLSSQVDRLIPGEFIIDDWKQSGLNVPSKVRRFFLTQDGAQIRRQVGVLTPISTQRLDDSLRIWLGLA